MKVPTYGCKLVCDGCGETFETGEGFVCFANDADGSQIREEAENSEWINIGGKDYCRNCYHINDRDQIVTKDGRVFDYETEEELTVNIINEDDLKTSIEEYKSMFPKSYTNFEKLKSKLISMYDNDNESSVFGIEVSPEWEDKCYGFKYVTNTPELTYEFIGIMKV